MTSFLLVHHHGSKMLRSESNSSITQSPIGWQISHFFTSLHEPICGMCVCTSERVLLALALWCTTVAVCVSATREWHHHQPAPLTINCLSSPFGFQACSYLYESHHSLALSLRHIFLKSQAISSLSRHETSDATLSTASFWQLCFIIRSEFWMFKEMLSWYNCITSSLRTIMMSSAYNNTQHSNSNYRMLYFDKWCVFVCETACKATLWGLCSLLFFVFVLFLFWASAEVFRPILADWIFSPFVWRTKQTLICVADDLMTRETAWISELEFQFLCRLIWNDTLCFLNMTIILWLHFIS